MSNKSSSFKFARIVPTGTLAALCGIGAIANLFQNLTIACVIGTVGILIGLITLKMRVEKIDKIFAVIGIILSLIPMFYAIIIIARK